MAQKPSLFCYKLPIADVGGEGLEKNFLLIIRKRITNGMTTNKVNTKLAASEYAKYLEKYLNAPYPKSWVCISFP